MTKGIYLEAEVQKWLESENLKTGISISKLINNICREKIGDNTPTKKEAIKPVEPTKPKTAKELPKKLIEPIKTAKNSIYSTAKRPSAKDSPNRTVIKF